MTDVDTNTGEQVVFWVCATLAVAGALGMVLSRKAVHSALWIALTMINLAVLYVANSAPFLGMVQVIVYTGAVMMLFLFVLMVVGVDSSDSLIETIKGQRLASILLTLGLGILLVWGVGSGLAESTTVGLDAANEADGGNVEGIANLIFTRYLLVFELTSALLITAAMGAMVLAHRERWKPHATQRDLSVARFSGGGHPGNLPNPGVYARHNAVDTPALLPDGGTLDISVPGPRACSRRRAAARPSRPGRRRADHGGQERMNPSNYVVLSAILFSIGAVGVLVRRNAIVVFMSVELMLNASNLAFVSFARMNGNLDGQVVAFFVMVVAAAEVVVGLAIIVTIFRTRRSASIDEPNLLKY